ncbi:hypothetical protein [Massilia sp. BHUDP2]|uniref:hypothetical protein n=1 Tax=Massilia sp. BHUDP2 TaxID=3034505 RepID=UPI0039061EC8
MALVQCKECGGSVSNSAAVCPHCGVAAPALSVAEKRQLTIDLKRAAYGRLGGFAFFAGIAWVCFPMLSGAEKEAVVSAWGGAKFLIFGGLLAYVISEIDRNLELRRRSKK